MLHTPKKVYSIWVVAIAVYLVSWGSHGTSVAEAAALFPAGSPKPLTTTTTTTATATRRKNVNTSDDGEESRGQQQQQQPGVAVLDETRSGGTRLSVAPALLLRNLPWRFRRPGWLKLPPAHVVDQLATGAKYVALGVMVYELAVLLKDLVQEAMNELDLDQDESGTSGSLHTPLLGLGSNQAILSPKAARKIVAWLEEGKVGGEGESRPPNISPLWMIPVAQSLFACKNVPATELERILCQLTRSEAALLETCLLQPDSHSASFRDVGGLFAAKATICQWLASFKLSPIPSLSPVTKQAEITVPHFVQRPESPYAKLLQKESPSESNSKLNGLILYGPPGCGKSLLIRAISNHSGLPTVVVTPSLIQRKWYGESTNRIRTLFGLIDKLESVCVVLDEVDGILRARREDDHEVSREVKTEWLQWWDGVASSMSSSSSSSTGKRLVVAATNHPWDVDIAAWRRFKHRVFVGYPNAQDRLDLLKKWTEDLPAIEPSVLEYMVGVSEGYTPSDLYLALQSACRSGPVVRSDNQLTAFDFQSALQQVRPTQLPAQYAQRLHTFMASNRQAAAGAHVPHLAQSTVPMGTTSAVPPSATDDSYCWTTPWGNFYQFAVPVDSQVIEAIDELLWTWNDWEPSDDDYLDDFDDDTDDDFDFDEDNL